MPRWTDEDIKYLEDNFRSMPNVDLGIKLNRSASAVKRFLYSKEWKRTDDELHKVRVQVSRRPNAGQFKKGSLPHNTSKVGDGDITIRTDHKDRNGRQYKWIRLELGRWELLQKVIWEEENGKVPEGYCLWFIDGNSLNCTLENLELITRAENINRNWHSKYPQELKNSILKLSKIKKIIKTKEYGKANFK
jgi:hypothetical protein